MGDEVHNMVVFERPIGVALRYFKVFMPTEEQLIKLASSIGRRDILRVFSAPPTLPDNRGPIARGWSRTTVVDLSKGQDAIYAGMHTNCRYKVRRAHKMRERFEIAVKTDAARADFFGFYNSFAKSKGLPQLKRHRFTEYLPHADVFMLYFEGQPTCGRLVLRDEETRTALMLYSGTRRFEKDADTITVGLLNRYLHWHEMKTYQAAGMQQYDFGGLGQETASVNNFKLSFGGKLKSVNSYLYVGSGRPLWKLAYSLYTRWTGESVRYTKAAAQFSTEVEDALVNNGGN